MKERKSIDPERILLENSLAFFGAITASVSHELNNVISIIDQNNGLLSDLLYGATQGRPISNERLQKIADSVTTQTERGVRIIKRLNLFSHSVDDPIREFELIHLVDNFVKLAQRLASLKKVKLDVSHEDSALVVVSSPFLLQQILFLSIQRALNHAQSEDIVKIITRTVDGKVSLEVHGRHDPAVETEWDEQYVNQLTSLIDGELDITAEGEEEIIKTSFKQRSG